MFHFPIFAIMMSMLSLPLGVEWKEGKGGEYRNFFLSQFFTVIFTFPFFLLGVKRILALIAIVTCVLVQSRPGSVARP